MTRHTIELYGGYAMAGTGALFLVTILGGLALGLGVRMFEIAAGRAQFARKRKRRSQRYVSRAPADRVVPLNELLDGGASTDTADLPVVTLDG